MFFTRYRLLLVVITSYGGNLVDFHIFFLSILLLEPILLTFLEFFIKLLLICLEFLHQIVRAFELEEYENGIPNRELPDVDQDAHKDYPAIADLSKFWVIFVEIDQENSNASNIDEALVNLTYEQGFGDE